MITCIAQSRKYLISVKQPKDVIPSTADHLQSRVSSFREPMIESALLLVFWQAEINLKCIRNMSSIEAEPLSKDELSPGGKASSIIPHQNRCHFVMGGNMCSNCVHL